MEPGYFAIAKTHADEQIVAAIGESDFPNLNLVALLFQFPEVSSLITRFQPGTKKILRLIQHGLRGLLFEYVVAFLGELFRAAILDGGQHVFQGQRDSRVLLGRDRRRLRQGQQEHNPEEQLETDKGGFHVIITVNQIIMPPIRRKASPVGVR
jgi:hypothetical protein